MGPDLCSKDDVLRIAANNGITDATNTDDIKMMEKLIMCFAIHNQIEREAHCVVRGGMCLLLHASGQTIPRLSEDIDIIVDISLGEITQVINKVCEQASLRCEIVTPSHERRRPIDNLVTYRIHYKSHFGGEGDVSVDFVYSEDITRLPTDTLQHDDLYFGLKVPAYITLFSIGALLADKLVTLGLKTIGMRPKRPDSSSLPSNTPKQIFDLGILLRKASRSDLESALVAFPAIVISQVSHRTAEPKHSPIDVCRDIVNSVDSLLSGPPTIALSEKQESSYANFSHRLVPGSSPSPKKHITDILLVKLFARHVCRSLGKGDAKTESMRLYNTLERTIGSNEFRSLDDVIKYYGHIPWEVKDKTKRMKQAPVEHAHLFIAIALLDGESK